MSQLTFLPSIMQGNPVLLSLGTQIDGRVSGHIQWVIPNRQYQIHIKWRDVETIKGIYDWSIYDPDFQALSGQKITVGIKVVPVWARLWKDYVASPPAPRSFLDLASFIIKVIERYNVDAVELFNEPDVDLNSTVQFGEYFGAWCLANDWYGGGLLYGQCLSNIYYIIKTAYPNVRIIAGALIGAIPSSLQFLDGAIHNGLKCDAISFHKYIGLNGNFNAAFEFGLEVRKRTPVMQILSETSITSNTDSLELQQQQASYLEYLRDNYQNSTIDAIQWYTLEGNNWLNSDLVHNKQVTPAYTEFIKES